MSDDFDFDYGTDSAVALAAKIRDDKKHYREVGFHWCWNCPPERRRKIARIYAEQPGGKLILWTLGLYQPISLKGQQTRTASYPVIGEPGGWIAVVNEMTLIEGSGEGDPGDVETHRPPEARPLPTAVGQKSHTAVATCPRCRHGLVLIPVPAGVVVAARVGPPTWGRVVEG